MADDAFFAATAWPWIFQRETDPKAPDAVSRDPNDPGGTTKYGFSQKAYPHLDIAALTRDQARELCYKDYWTALGAPTLPNPWALTLLDTAFNMGRPRATTLLTGAGEVDDYLFARLEGYREIVLARPRSLAYLPGWLRRVILLRGALGSGADAARP